MATAFIGHWELVIHWSLVIGHWSFISPSSRRRLLDASAGRHGRERNGCSFRAIEAVGAQKLSFQIHLRKGHRPFADPVLLRVSWREKEGRSGFADLPRPRLCGARQTGVREGDEKPPGPRDAAGEKAPAQPR